MLGKYINVYEINYILPFYSLNPVLKDRGREGKKEKEGEGEEERNERGEQE